MNLLDIRRQNNVAIGLSRFYKRFTDQELLDSICSHADILSSEDITTLIPLLPTEEEKQLLGLYSGSFEELGVVERFMMTMKKEEQIIWMCEALLFEHQFFTELRAIEKQIEELTLMMKRLRENNTLKLLLKLVLEIGNLANYDYGRSSSTVRMKGKALGFKMDSLIKLQDVKSVDRKTNLMNYLAMISEERDTEIRSKIDEFADLSRLKFSDTGSITETLISLNRGLDKMKNENMESTQNSRIEEFRKKQRAFIDKAQEDIDSVNTKMEAMQESWIQTSSFFGENPKERKIEELFMILDQFFRNFKEACVQNGAKLKVHREKLKDHSVSNRKMKTMSMLVSSGSHLNFDQSEDGRSDRSFNTLAMADYKLSLSLSFDDSVIPSKCPECENEPCVCKNNITFDSDNK